MNVEHGAGIFSMPEYSARSACENTLPNIVSVTPGGEEETEQKEGREERRRKYIHGHNQYPHAACETRGAAVAGEPVPEQRGTIEMEIRYIKRGFHAWYPHTDGRSTTTSVDSNAAVDKPPCREPSGPQDGLRGPRTEEEKTTKA